MKYLEPEIVEKMLHEMHAVEYPNNGLTFWMMQAAHKFACAYYGQLGFGMDAGLDENLDLRLWNDEQWAKLDHAARTYAERYPDCVFDLERFVILARFALVLIANVFDDPFWVVSELNEIGYNQWDVKVPMPDSFMQGE